MSAHQQTVGTPTLENNTTGGSSMPITKAEPAPPAYNDEKSGTSAAAAPAPTATPNQPRTDDPAKQEMTYNNDQPPAMVTPRESLRYDPAWIDCPFCQKRSLTDVRKVESDTTWIYTLLCCICCGCIGAIFPLIFGWGSDFDHYCKTCNNRVARVPHEGSSNAMVQVFGPQAVPGQAVSSVPMQQSQPQQTMPQKA